MIVETCAPMKRGLKGTGAGLPTDNFFIVETCAPMKRGLKVEWHRAIGLPKKLLKPVPR